MEQDLHEEGGPSWERALWQRLFLPSSDSAGSPEEEERVAGPSQDKGKGHAPTSEEVRGEVTGVVCDLCERKGIPCRWGKVSIPAHFFLFCLLIWVTENSPRPGLPGLSASLGQVPCGEFKAGSTETNEGGGEPGGGAQQADAGEASAGRREQGWSGHGPIP